MSDTLGKLKPFEFFPLGLYTSHGCFGLPHNISVSNVIGPTNVFLFNPFLEMFSNAWTAPIERCRKGKADYKERFQNLFLCFSEYSSLLKNLDSIQGGVSQWESPPRDLPSNHA